MKLLKMTGHQCMLYSLAMILEESPDGLIKELGHDGTERWWPDHAIPYCYRGYHIQEFVDLCLNRGKTLTPVEHNPRSGSAKSPHIGRRLFTMEEAERRFKRLVAGRWGILIGQSNHGGHACAWDGHRVYDPNGKIYSLGNFSIQSCWLLGSEI